MKEMADDEFLLYCETHADTPRCGFVPQQLARLLTLAGQTIAAEYWAKEPNRVVDCDRYQIKDLVTESRARLAAKT